MPTRATLKAIGLGFFAFLLLTGRFSPNWRAFHAGVQDAYQQAASPAERAAVEKAVLSGYAERGWHVLNQSRDLSTVVDDPNHKIVRWRLLMPWVGHFLHLPGWATLGLAHLGCLLWLAYLAVMLRSEGGTPAEILPLILVLGATAPFFASMGMLGYYDSWLVLGLLVVVHTPRHWMMWLACLLTPWVDERFVLGLPLALLVRWVLADRAVSTGWRWVRDEALGPALLTAGYAVIRLSLGGGSGSQTVGEYLRQFVLTPEITPTQRLYGAWSGLRMGWLLIFAALVGVWPRRGPAWLLTAALLITWLVGLVTALDLSRSMALLMPAVSAGAVLVTRTKRWSWKWKWSAATLAMALPAAHVMGMLALPVDKWWVPSRPLFTAQNSLANHFASMPTRHEDALIYYAAALRLDPDSAETHNNLAILLAATPNRQPEALSHYAEALRLNPRYAEAHNNLANLLAVMPNRQTEALNHYMEALRLKPDYAEVHFDLAVLLAAMPNGQSEALSHYSEAVRLKSNYVEAQNNLANLLAKIPGRQSEALAHYAEALHFNPDYPEAHNNLANLLATMPDRRQEALEHYKAAIRRVPNNAGLHFNLARLLENFPEGKAEAESNYQAALTLDPNFSAARESLERLRSSGH